MPPGAICTACGAPRAHSTAAPRSDLMRITASKKARLRGDQKMTPPSLLHRKRFVVRICPPPRARNSCASKRVSPVAHAPLASSAACSASALRTARQAALCAGQSCTWCSLQQ
jgi:hypothetical protein